ncbi:LysR family transcriptional regulator [Clostridium tagluense]|uniref:LysR family transcriptional regulator n=1 Tax=Clostridium tagluense TaxID=360422 RepID=UPI001CF335BE|nr:LysR family transcriptional regulator [Clostridium tagluense]MCB2312116.1 LysR family transcriptional regulator [Clostridium tagluense]MCB2316699.1 LysR family transcriptional regulator [Clostridium tagluense]MCB2321561.1 LysR family transcriptional regulator [Clostridium tagluense]MCB2326568.1 LysR family transcriptional regulator [Clostridium tagluense]MCB2331291.1 LysR family transcriptional regulator [Clostridium tagluense]
MEIRHLQTFITIVQLGGFTKTAKHLGYAQSTITSHIQILENELGEVLFDRLGKKIVLTNVGKELVPYAKQMLNIYKEIKNITSEPNGVSGDLIIGAVESLSIYRLGEILKEYKKSYPKVNIILKNSICSDLRSKLHSGELDIIFTIEPQIMDTDLIVKNLKDERMIIIGAPDADLEFLSTDFENEVARESIIFSEKGCSFRIAFENYLKQKKIKYANPLEFSSIEATKKCVMNGLGISFLPFYTVRNEIKEKSLKIVELKESFHKFSTQLAYHKNKSISLPMSKLIEITLKNSSNWK